MKQFFFSIYDTGFFKFNFRFKFPSTKDEVIKLLNRGIIYTFRYHVWSQGHAATNYNFWRNASKPYEVSF